jgi:hypothetical protein
VKSENNKNGLFNNLLIELFSFKILESLIIVKRIWLDIELLESADSTPVTLLSNQQIIT